MPHTNGAGLASGTTDNEARIGATGGRHRFFKPGPDKAQVLLLEYVLAALRSAALRTRLAANEIDTIGLALRSELITPEAALLWARDAGVLKLVSNEEIETGATDIVLAAT
jgi:hypothetical protein